MLEACELAEAVIAALTPKQLSGKKIVMTAGPTFRPIDPVRGITNQSSGQMGYAMARTLHRQGPTWFGQWSRGVTATPWGVTRVSVQTAEQMRQAVMRANCPGAGIRLGVAAVADYRPLEVAEHKLKTASVDSDGGRTITLTHEIQIFWRKWPLYPLHPIAWALRRKARIWTTMPKPSVCVNDCLW